MIDERYSYKDIALLPSYSEVRSRSQIDTKINFLDYQFDSVTIPANMKCTINESLAYNLAHNNIFYIMHRFMDYDEYFEFINVMNIQNLLTSISVGVNEKDYRFIDRIKNYSFRVNFITIDVAHGHHKLVKDMIEYIRNNLNDVKIIAGNIGTVEGAINLRQWGADAVKVGLSMGKSCSTYNTTGVGTPMFSTIKEISDKVNVPIIADGQIREVGDVCKALVAGASMVMIGSEFARCEDSPAKIEKRLEDGFAGIYSYWKEFYGSASEHNKGHKNYIEGNLVRLPMKNITYLDYIDQINQGIQSCMSYAGVNEISQLKSMDFCIYRQ